ncbi:hypothetical protein BKI52_30015 [marine bacterium AO1-C]|nr:hypothetical protein BKI52_30015 [marine bacterium AO1-C]
MNVLIIEDEYIARENLKIMLAAIDNTIQVLAEAASITEAINVLQQHPEAQLAFLDIELADGNSFQIFETLTPTIPVIFTTAYSEFALQAFKLNSVDYLLKPITQEALQQAITKYKNIHQKPVNPDYHTLQQLIQNLSTTNTKTYQQSFLIEKGDSLVPIKTQSLAYIYIENGIVKGVTTDNKTYHLNEKLEKLNEQLDPAQFFRANRQFIVNREVITKISVYFHGKLVVHTIPPSPEKIIVSKAKAGEFKQWMNAPLG